MADTDWGKRDSRGEWQPAPELLPKPSAPGFDRTAHFQVGWIAEIYARNAVILILEAGGLHLRLARESEASSSTTSSIARTTGSSR